MSSNGLILKRQTISLADTTSEKFMKTKKGIKGKILEKETISPFFTMFPIELTDIQ